MKEKNTHPERNERNTAFWICVFLTSMEIESRGKLVQQDSCDTSELHSVHFRSFAKSAFHLGITGKQKQGDFMVHILGFRTPEETSLSITNVNVHLYVHLNRRHMEL